MSKHQVIEQICQHNRSASPQFLVRFDQKALDTYLRRLVTLQGHRGPATAWIRGGYRPATHASSWQR